MLNFKTRLSADGKGLTSWVKLLPLGEKIDYKGRAIDFSADYLKKIVSETQRLNAYFDKKAGAGTAYRQPIWREHEGATETDGSVDDVRFAERAGFKGVWVKLTRTPDAQAAIASGKIKYVSAGIVPEYQVESGEKFGPVIREVSLTADPFLKSIGTIQDSLTVQLSHPLRGAQPTIDEETMEALKAAIAALQAAANGVADAIEGIDAAQDDVLEEEEELSAVDAATDDDEEEEKKKEDLSSIAAQTAAVKALNVELAKNNQLTERAIKLGKLNLRESGRQGGGEPAPVELSYSATIEKIMKDKGLDRIAAIDLYHAKR